MFLSRLVIMLVLTLSAISLQAGTTGQDVTLSLRALADADCNGQSDINAATVPGGCLIYEIEALNQGQKSYQNVRISAYIPEYTELFEPYSLVRGNFEPVSRQHRRDGHRLLETELPVLLPGALNKIILRYQVRIQ